MGGFHLIFNSNSQINLIALLAFHFIFAFVLYKEKIGFSIFLSLIVSFSIAITEIVASSIIFLITNSDTVDFSKEHFKNILLILISKTLLLLIMKVIGDIINKYRSNERIDFSFFFYMFSLFVVLVAFTKVIFEYKISTQDQILIAVAGFVLLIAVVTTCITQQLTSQKTKELFELKAEKQKQELDSTYFNLLEHQNDELQLFVHDTKKHFHNLYDLLDNTDKSKEYIKKIVKDIDESNKIGKTSNKMLDLILHKYNFICEENDILFKKDIHYSNLDFIDDADLTSIFNNLLDNAIEATESSANKYISLSINKIESILFIEISNSSDTPPLVRKNQLLSTKTDNKLHGYGFKSIKKAVKKYNGDIEWEYNDTEKVFTVSILFASKN